MSQKALGPKFVLASHNQGKLAEFSELLAPLGREVVSAGALGLPEPEETGTTFEANALLKAEAARDATGLSSLSDDSGLSVEALEGDPGVYSARWAGPEKDFAAAMEKIRRALETKGISATGAKAKFVCVIALALPDGAHHLFPGEIYGTLVFPPRGPGGFGYDPCFVPDGLTQTFGEMDKAAKQAISHRALAVAKFRAWLAQ